MAQAKAGGKATTNTGGRVVSLTDGREYAITGASLVFGRDASCDVVVAGKDVSRRHAEIMQTPKGYLLVDASTNGTSVNEVRLEGQRLLARADVITIGEEKFRFYADTPAPSPPSPPPPPPPAPPPPPPPAPAAPPPPAAVAESAAPAARLRETVHGMPAAPRPTPGGGGGALANFVVKSGALKGKRLTVKTPVVNIGRADYNDIVLPDESVSTTHAKLQRREGVWVLIDLDSTNGTYVDGDQVKGEIPLAPGANVRFGEIGLVFEPTDDAAAVAKGGATRMMEQMVMQPAPAPKAAPKPKPPAPKPAGAKPAAKPKGAKAQVAEQKKAKGCGGSAAVILLVIVVLAYWVFI
jgi:pSer/pThr/pTyr-binding forkhead associated (FHA) protein